MGKYWTSLNLSENAGMRYSEICKILPHFPKVMFGSTQFSLLFILGIISSVFLPMHSELLCFIDSYNLKRALFSSLAPPQTTSWHLAAFFFFFSFLRIFAYGSLVLSQPKLNCDTEYWLRGLFSPSLQERLCLIWAKVLYSREGELHLMICPQDEEKCLEGV